MGMMRSLEYGELVARQAFDLIEELRDPDPFDPRYIEWPKDDDVCRMYGDDNGVLEALVDRIDYEWAIQWRWCWKFSRPDKYYLRRAWRPPGPGSSLLRPVTLLLHVEIQKRTGIEPPTPAHRLVDHRN